MRRTTFVALGALVLAGCGRHGAPSPFIDPPDPPLRASGAHATHAHARGAASRAVAAAADADDGTGRTER
jgi:hypothetical protein